MNKQLLTLFKNIRSPYHRGETLLLSALSILKKYNPDPQKTILTAIHSLRPGVKILTKIIAGRVIPLPAYQREDSANYWAIRWLLKAARERTSKSFRPTDLVDEINDTLKKRGLAYKSKMDVIKDIRDARVNLQKSFRKFKRFKPKVFKHRLWDPKNRFRNPKYRSLNSMKNRIRKMVLKNTQKRNEEKKSSTITPN